MKKTLTLLLISGLGFTANKVVAQTIPADCISVYDELILTEQCPRDVEGAVQYQFLGPGSGWGDLADLDFSAYKTLVLGITFDASDAGNQVAVRFNVNGATGAANVKAHIITLPATGTFYEVRIDLTQYAGTNGEIGVGGLIFYNGAAHWSLTYTGTPAAALSTVDYLAVSKTPLAPTAVKNTKFNNANGLVDVMSLTGVAIRRNVKTSEATIGLKPGIYLVGGQKVVVKKQ
jgi:hypothetical protein